MEALTRVPEVVETFDGVQLMALTKEKVNCSACPLAARRSARGDHSAPARAPSHMSEHRSNFPRTHCLHFTLRCHNEVD
ncbi:unnamed protein product [Colias eurytheme]|nr:unnamed protein product [Colias eurytheme]